MTKRETVDPYSEIRLAPAPKRGASLRVALCFPDRYQAATSALGYQLILERFNSLPGVAAERFILPTSRNEPPRSLEFGAPLADFDVVAFSVPYELQYVHIPGMLIAGGIPPTKASRTNRDPLVIAGGPAVTMNPSPLEAFVDAFVIGEAETTVAKIGPALLAHGPDRRLTEMASIQGVYVPRVSATPVRARHIDRLDDIEPTSHILSPRAEFANTLLAEVMRGCRRSCKFCLAKNIYAPQRLRTPQCVLDRIDARLSCMAGPAPSGLNVGLVGPAVSDHPGLTDILSGVIARGLRVSTSSLRLDSLTPDIARLLVEGGGHSLTLAPECGSERLRRAIGKTCSDQTVLEACRVAADAGFKDVKLYFMVGLPTETDDDIRAIPELLRRIQAEVGFQRCSVSVAPFVPKPHTPFEREPMATLDVIAGRIAVVESEGRRIAGVSVRGESPTEAALQCVLARGGSELGGAILGAAESGRSLWSMLKKAVDPAPYLAGEIPGPPPWGVVSTLRK